MQWLGLFNCIFCTIFKLAESNTNMLVSIPLKPIGASGQETVDPSV